MSGVHARIAPSSLSRTVACPGSLKLSEQCPTPPEIPEALEGDVAHWVAMQRAMGMKIPPGTKHKGVVIDEDMVGGAETWTSYIGEFPGAYEMPVYASDIHEECWGSSDYWASIPERNLLRIGDYKYGHLYVEEYENEQMVAYGSAVISMLQLPMSTKVELTIVQPRCYSAPTVRTWTTTAAHITFLAKRYAVHVAEALGDNPTSNVTSECLFCPARAYCKTIQQMSENIIEFSRSMQTVDAANPQATGLELALIEESIKTLTARKTGLEQVAEAAIRNGGKVPGWEMKPGRANLAWVDPAAALAASKEAGVDLTKAVDLITPTQALDRKLVDAAFIDKLASRPTAALKLARVRALDTRKLFALSRG